MMDQIDEFCSIQGHREMHISHFCIFDKCDKQRRRCCAECIKEKIHNHDNCDDLSHLEGFIKLQEKLHKNLIIIQQDHQKYLSDYKNQIKIKVEEITKISIRIIYELQHLECSRSLKQLSQYVEDSQKHNFQFLDDEFINRYLNIDPNNYIFNIQSQLKPINQIEQNCLAIQNHIELLNLPIDLQQVKFNLTKVDQTKTYFNASQISNNLLYLSYGGEDKILKIYDIRQKQIIKQIDLLKQIYVCQFTNDSSQLFVGLSGGYVCGFKMDGSFEQIFQKQIHKQNVLNIIIIQNESLITCSRDCSIIKTDIKTQKKLFQLNGHSINVTAIDYNEIYDTVISGSADKSLKLWNCKNQNILINKENSHTEEIRQIQFINNKQNILSLDRDGCLIKWKIDINNQDLIKIQQYQDQNKIYNFYSVNQGLNMLLLCDKYLSIINEQYEQINIINHEQFGRQTYNEQKQIDHCKIIQIRTGQKMMLAIMQN